MNARTPMRKAVGLGGAALLSGAMWVGIGCAVAVLLSCGSAHAAARHDVDQLDQVNRLVNRSTVYDAHYSTPQMAVIGGATGNCADMATTKRIRLAAAGWPLDDLRLVGATVPTRTGTDRHVLLLARDDRGRWWALDNRYASVQDPRALERDGYEFDR